MAVVAALCQLYGPRPLRWLSIAYVEFFRGTSALVQLFWLFFVLPDFGISMAPFTVAVLGLGLNVGAYGAEVVRGAIQGVQRGQWEATTALNMTRWQALRRIILPQALRVIIPPAGNQFVSLLKATSLVSVIAGGDLLTAATNISSGNLRTIELLLVATFWYLAVTSLTGFGQFLIERRLARSTARADARR